MKRIGAFFLAFLLLCACGAPGAQGSALEQANRHLDTPFSLAMPAEEAEKHATQYRYGGGFGGFTLENQDARYMLSGYPDVLDAYHVTEIRLLSTKYHIFGVTLYDELQDALEAFQSYGFTEDESRSEDTRLVMTNENVELILAASEGILYDLRIDVIATSVEGVGF